MEIDRSPHERASLLPAREEWIDCLTCATGAKAAANPVAVGV
jgi:hypothetical protein